MSNSSHADAARRSRVDKHNHVESAEDDALRNRAR